MTLKVEVNVLPVRDGDIGEATITICSKHRGTQEVVRTITVVPGSEKAKRTLIIDDDQQITIDGKVEMEMYLDPVQNCVMERPKRG